MVPVDKPLLYSVLTAPSGETLSEPHKLYRIEVVTAFMTAGAPLSKVEFLDRSLRKMHIDCVSDEACLI